MKTKKELKQLQANIGHAIMVYLSAIAENLKELNCEVPVQGDDKEVCGVDLSIPFDEDLNDCVISKVKYSAEKNEIMCFCTHWNYKECNEWMPLSELGDEYDYVLDAIQWPKS